VSSSIGSIAKDPALVRLAVQSKLSFECEAMTSRQEIKVPTGAPGKVLSEFLISFNFFVLTNLY
jgi:hypothetical protein